MKQGIGMFRQGDVLLIEVDSFPAFALPHEVAQTILAVGEVQGHTHRLESRGTIKTYDLPGMMGVAVLEKPASLVHGAPGIETPDAHKTQILPPGKYVRVIQHEWDPQFEKTQVRD